MPASTSSIKAGSAELPLQARPARGTEGNELLTSLTGAALIVLLAALGLTIIAIGRLLWLHLFIGLALAGPLLLKLASTSYRFVRYYTGNAIYRRKGPPPTVLRVIAPVVVLSTLTVMGSGVALLLAGPGARHTLLPVHKVSFFVWLAVTAPHVLAHLPALARAAQLDYPRNRSSSPAGADGKVGRALALGGALTLGVVLAVLLIPEYGAWVHAHSLHDH